MGSQFDSAAAYLVERPLLGRRQALWLGLIAPALIAIPLSFAGDWDLIAALEGATIDLRFRERGPRETETRIVIVEIDKADRMALRQGETAFNLRENLATAIDRLAESGALATGVDFWLEGTTTPEVDDRLASAIQNANVVLGMTHTGGMLERAPASIRGDTASEGVITVYPDAAGNVLRRLPANLYVDVLPEGAPPEAMQRVWHFPIAMAWFAEVERNEQASVSMREGRAHIGEHAVAPRELIDWVYVGGEREGEAPSAPPNWTVLQLADVVRGDFDAQRVDGALVLIGESREIADAHRMPLADRLAPGVYYHANAIAHIMDDRSFREAWSSPQRRRWLTGGLALAAGLYGWLLLPWWRYRRGGLLLANYVLGGIAIFPGGWILAATAMFHRGTLVPVAAPLVAMAVALAAGLAAQWVVLGINARRLAERARRIETLFGRSVSASVLEAIQREPHRIGRIETREVTVLFGDLRSFTSLTADMPPAEVAALLNEYYEYITQAVFEQDGFLDKFVGDEIMAVFSVPFEQQDHPERAVRAALNIKQRLARLNAARAARGEAPLDCGLGIHSGHAAAGHIGSTERSNYTVVGATVNMAARIEQLTKRGEVLISDAVRTRLPSWVTLRPWAPVEIRGLPGSHAIYEVMADNAGEAAGQTGGSACAASVSSGA